MRRIRNFVLGCTTMILVHELPGQEIKLDEPQELDSSKFVERTVWIPYWTEKDGRHALLQAECSVSRPFLIFLCEVST